MQGSEADTEDGAVGTDFGAVDGAGGIRCQEHHDLGNLVRHGGAPLGVLFGVIEHEFGGHARGAGLGLNICKVLVNLSGGQIRVESQQGEWCRFVFTLPTVAPNPGGMKRLPDEAGGEPTVEDPASMKPVE